MSQARVSAPLAWVWVGDLFLRARVEGLARAAGLAVRFFATPAALTGELAAGTPPPALVVADLGDRAGEGFALLEALAARRQAAAAGAAGAAGGTPPVLAFYSHVDAAARQRALELGATRVVPRSAFVARFAELVREVSARAAG